jgi:hypothetical protein
MMLFSGLGRGGDVVVGWPVVRDPRAEASSESEVFRDPSGEASDGEGRWVGLFTCLAGGPTREDLACFPFVDCFPLKGPNWPRGG